MNYHTPKRRSNLTTKCQVTIPKEIRDALGLGAGDAVEFELDGTGRATIAPVNRESEREAHIERIRKGILKAQQAFKEQDCMPEGMTNQEWFDMMRGPPAEV
jgi:AbrB family looped-hinge helix DNA binding protein